MSKKGSTWSPERKAALSEKMKARHSENKAKPKLPEPLDDANAQFAKTNQTVQGNAPTVPVVQQIPQKRIQVEKPYNPMIGSYGDDKYKDDDEWHHFLCVEQPKDMNAPSERAKFLRAGYEVEEEVQEGMCWMRCSQAMNQRNLRQQEEATAKVWERPLAEEPEKENEAKLVSITHSRTPQLVNAQPAN